MFLRKSNSPCVECPRPSIYEDNVEAFELFMDCQTQFNYHLSGPIGLRFEAVEFAMKCQRIEPSPELFEKIKILELKALEILRNAN